MRQLAQRSPKLVSRRGADLTKILREDDVRPELVEKDLVHLVEALARREMRGDSAIDIVLRDNRFAYCDLIPTSAQPTTAPFTAPGR